MKKLATLKIDKLPVVITKQVDNLFVAESPVLDIVTQGKSLEEVKERFAELVLVFFEELVERDTLVEVLGSLGWSKQKKSWKPPVLVESSYQEVSVPINISLEQKNG